MADSTALSPETQQQLAAMLDTHIAKADKAHEARALFSTRLATVAPCFDLAGEIVRAKGGKYERLEGAPSGAPLNGPWFQATYGLPLSGTNGLFVVLITFLGEKKTGQLTARRRNPKDGETTDRDTPLDVGSITREWAEATILELFQEMTRRP